KRRRTTKDELDVLEAFFTKTPLPTSAERQQLAETTGMTLRAVQVWFQNRRQTSR
ncbi:Homeodomain-like protein, partial [Chytridium lagenaria]